MADVDSCQSPTVTTESIPEVLVETSNQLPIEDPVTQNETNEPATDLLKEDNNSTATTESIFAKTGNNIENATVDSISVPNKMIPTPEPEKETPVLTSCNDDITSDASRKTNDLENDVEMSDVMTKPQIETDDNNDLKSISKQNGDINGEHPVEPMEVDEETQQKSEKQLVNSTNDVKSAKDTNNASEDNFTNSSTVEEETNFMKNDNTISEDSIKLPETVELLDESGEGERVEKKIDDAEKPINTSSVEASEPAVKEVASAKPNNGAQEEESVILDSDSEEEPMEVDGRTNGVLNDDDKPVSIGSDTDSESDLNTSQSNSRDVPTNDNSNDVHEILSDKEDDCVVIDDNKSSSPTPLGNRSAHDEDPLGAAHHSQSSASSSPVSFSINKNNKSPSLVVVDTAKLLGKSSGQTQPINLQKTPTSVATKTANLLPNLTDDMFVLEAPSFIVPYIYEKPPSTALKEIVTTMGKEVEEQVRKEAEERRLKEESEMSVKEKQKKLLEEAAEKEKKKKKQTSRRKENDDDEWDEEIDSSEDSDEEGEGVTRVLIKDVEDDLLAIKEHIITPETIKEAIIGGEGKKSDNFFESPLGKFFMGIGVNLVQEHVQTDLLRQQKRKRDREGTNPSESTMMAINSLMKNLETSKENNAPFKFELKRCEYCNFKSESALAMAHHYETPHMKNNVYRCNFCSFETKNTGEVMWHMEAMHNIKGRLEKPLSYHQCPNCTFEDNGRSKLARHSVACAKKFKPESNLSAPLDWDPPAKIPKIKPKHGLVGTATAYQLAAQQQQAALLAQQQKAAAQAAAQQQRTAAMAAAMQRGRGGRGQQVPLVTKPSPTMIGRTNITPVSGSNASPQQLMQRMMNQGGFNLGMSGGQYMQNSPVSGRSKQNQPSISITPVPRSSGSSSSQQAFNPVSAAATTKFPPGVSPGMKPGQNPNASGKTQFVICEICDGYIKDLDQLRNHMQWIHKVKIHPKMIYNRPPLNCQKCQYRFFTDQGLERHLLGSHGLVTSSMQEAANKGKDAGRCPVCGRVYQWKLLNHVSRDHNMTLKPAHLSYKCTVCTATFGMYKQFENHVYSAHSTVAKKSGDRKSSGGNPSSSSASGSGASNNQSLLKPLKINDEITIIPQPSKPVIANSKPIEIE